MQLRLHSVLYLLYPRDLAPRIFVDVGRWRDLNRFQEMTATFLELLTTLRTFLDCTGRPTQPGIRTTSYVTALAPATPTTRRYIRRCEVFRSHVHWSSIRSTAELINYSELAQKFIYLLTWMKKSLLQSIFISKIMDLLRIVIKCLKKFRFKDVINLYISQPRILIHAKDLRQFNWQRSITISQIVKHLSQ